MAFDSIKQKVESYVNKKNKLDEDYSEFSDEFNEFQNSVSQIGNLDGSIMLDINQAMSNYEQVESDFGSKFDDLNDEKKTNEDDISNEISRINSGKSKLSDIQSSKYGSAVTKPVDVSNEYLEKYNDLLKELDTDFSGFSDTSGSGSTGDTFFNPIDNTVNQNTNAGLSSINHNISSAVQSAHKNQINNLDGMISAVQDDVSTSGISISKDRASQLLRSVQLFSGSFSTDMRKAYLNPDKDPQITSAMHDLDAYINASPKWKGTIFRGINVSSDVFNKMKSDGYVDMLGPSSWSSDQSVSNRFTRGPETGLLFRLKNNKSGASITHISSFSNEKEVTVPSGVVYKIDSITKTTDSFGRSFFIIDVHE